MRDLFYRRSIAVLLCWVPTLLWGAPNSQEPYLVRPSTQTIQRRESVMALGSSQDPLAGPKLVEALSDKDPMTRSLAAQGLGSLKYSAGVPALIGRLAGDSSAEVRQTAVLSLQQIHDPRAIVPLEKALSDTELNVRLTALRALERYRDPGSEPAVEAACKDMAPEVRRTAVYVLGRMRDQAAVPTLQKLLKSDSDDAVRAGAAQALGEMRSTESKGALRPLLKDPNKTVQASAARSLLILGDSSGFETAKALDHDPDLAVRVVAIDGLGWSKDPSAESELQALLASGPGDSRPAAQAALLRTQKLRKQP